VELASIQTGVRSQRRLYMSGVAGAVLLSSTLIAGVAAAQSTTMSGSRDLSGATDSEIIAADSQPLASPPASAPAAPTQPGASAPASVTETEPSNTAPFDKWKPLQLRGVIVPIPEAPNTLGQNLFGIRDSLADQGIGFTLWTTSYDADNVAKHQGVQNGTQLYTGQKNTWQTGWWGFVTYDLGHVGDPGGQLVLGGVFLRTNWNPTGPISTALASAYYYQSLFNNRIEFKIGYMANTLDYIGTYIAGNYASSVFGTNASIPYEVGQNSLNFATPAVNVKFNFGNFYEKSGIQRPISPDGTVAERNENPSSFDFTVRNAGILSTNEIGYNQPSAPGVGQTWVRLTGDFNTSQYKDFKYLGTRHSDNYGLFLLGDHQFWQVRPDSAATARQGLYAGFSAMYAPARFNTFTQYYELRAYGIGLIPHRPDDMVAFVFADNVFSRYLIREDALAGNSVHSSAQTETISYSAHVFRGVNINFGLSYINHPTTIIYNEHTGHALNPSIGTVTFF